MSEPTPSGAHSSPFSSRFSKRLERFLWWAALKFEDAAMWLSGRPSQVEILTVWIETCRDLGRANLRAAVRRDGSSYAIEEEEALDILDRTLDNVLGRVAALGEAPLTDYRWEVEQSAKDAEIARLRKCLVAHHEIGTLSEAVLKEHDFRGCPVCQRADITVRTERGLV